MKTTDASFPAEKKKRDPLVLLHGCVHTSSRWCSCAWPPLLLPIQGGGVGGREGGGGWEAGRGLLPTGRGWWPLTHISCRGRLISTLSLFTAGSADPRDASASLPRSLIWSAKDTSGGRKQGAEHLRLFFLLLLVIDE